jgi:hypothetical protein
MGESQHPDPGSGLKTRIIFFRAQKPFFFAFLGLKIKILKFFDEDPGWRQFGSGIRDGKKSDPGSGMEKSRIRGSGINIPDPPHWLNPPKQI